MRVLLAVLLATAAAIDSPVPHRAPSLPQEWKRLDTPVADDHPIALRLSLRQTNLDTLFDIARNVSNPQSSMYGQYLTSAELESLTAPREQDVSAVTAWLGQAGVRFSTPSKAVIDISISASALAAVLQTKFHNVGNSVTGQRAVQAEDYYVPASVESAVAAFYGMHGLPLPPRDLPELSATPATVTPAVIEATYSVTGVTPSGSEKNRQAVAEFQGQTMDPNDLSSFFKKYVTSAPSTDGVVHKFVGKNPTGQGGVEASLDIEYVMGVAPGLLTEFWYYGGNDFCTDLQQWTSDILANDDAPLVHSVSYGYQGDTSALGCKAAQLTDIDGSFAKLAAKGISIIFASGDSGSGTSGLFSKKMYPSWPASSPWVTAVGATRFVDQKVGQPEMATDQFGSGGGFSSMFDAFADQTEAVKNYLQTVSSLPPSGSFPPGGRATPDVSALGEGFQVLANGQTESVGGTSAAAPTFAGLVSLLNEARIAKGKAPMGYLNPFLYQNPNAFTDITVGTNAIGRSGQSFGKYGFACAKGWDPATGLGTPILTKLLDAAMKVAPTAVPSKQIVV